jgi:RNA polymerase sigma-70 factor (ECF subfamily)
MNNASRSYSTSTSLLRRVKNNEEEAWNRLVELYSPLVCYWCRRSKLSQEDTEEVCQETFRSVSQSIGKLRYEKPTDTFRGWLRCIVRNKITDAFNRNNRALNAAGGSHALQQLEQLPDTPDADENYVVGSLCRRAMQLMEDKFEPKTWQAFMLVVADGLDTQSAGKNLACHPVLYVTLATKCCASYVSSSAMSDSCF